VLVGLLFSSVCAQETVLWEQVNPPINAWGFTGIAYNGNGTYVMAQQVIPGVRKEGGEERGRRLERREKENILN
jgi:hypothetical protein